MIFIWFHRKKPWFLRVFPYWDGRIQPGAVVGIYENDEAAKTVTELFTKAVELGGRHTYRWVRFSMVQSLNHA